MVFEFFSLAFKIFTFRDFHHPIYLAHVFNNKAERVFNHLHDDFLLNQSSTSWGKSNLSPFFSQPWEVFLN